ncbi:hypothetical protein B0O99DRAFT_690769 [Bisporella sp. PMI_857]|nr:hypothetical protein B0O99DRAFT_690769 [Bisporella sp. PMI_857]
MVIYLILAFVICDAGGGTVDLISYTIEQLEPALQVREAAPGSCVLCRSTYLNRRFREFLVSKLGQEEKFEQETVNDAMKKFDEEIKREYSTGVKDADYWVPVPGLANNPRLCVRINKLKLPSDDVREILKPVIDEVLKLVQDQMRSTNTEVKGVLLVGGFGGSDAIKEDTPFTFRYKMYRPVSKGKPVKCEDIIYYDRTDRPAVIYQDEEVIELVRLCVKMHDLPSDALEIEIGKDDELYYTFRYAIEVTYQSGSTKYELLHKGE